MPTGLHHKTCPWSDPQQAQITRTNRRTPLVDILPQKAVYVLLGSDAEDFSFDWAFYKPAFELLPI